MSSKTIAVIPTIPGRIGTLHAALNSLAPQVDELHLVLNEWPLLFQEQESALYARMTDVAKARTTFHRAQPDLGSAGKMLFAESISDVDLYIGCDDDWDYPPDFVSTMRHWVERYHGTVICCAHGRVLRPEAEEFFDVRGVPITPQGGSPGAWVNYPGCAAVAFNPQVLSIMPDLFEKNLEEAGLAVWAQRHEVPIWAVPKPPYWLRYTRGGDRETLWDKGQKDGFPDRGRVLRTLGADWKVNRYLGGQDV